MADGFAYSMSTFGSQKGLIVGLALIPIEKLCLWLSRKVYVIATNKEKTHPYCSTFLKTLSKILFFVGVFGALYITNSSIVLNAIRVSELLFRESIIVDLIAITFGITLSLCVFKFLSLDLRPIAQARREGVL